MNYISKETITDIARKIAVRFDPEKIILFGSYAWGKPDRDSDLDIFVIMESTERLVNYPLLSQGASRFIASLLGLLCRA